MTRQSTHILLADIGGTHTRCAWLVNKNPTDTSIYQNNEYDSMEAVLGKYLSETGRSPDHVLLGVAGQVTNGRVKMLNRSWSCTAAEIAASTGATTVVLVNDFEALAYALPFLHNDQLRKSGEQAALTYGTKAIIGPGTGLGVSGLVWSGTRWIALSGEGGHVTLAATNSEEEALIHYLRDRYGRASAERAISGQGLSAIYSFFGGADTSPGDISRYARDGDKRALKALDLLFALLAGIAGDLALTLGSRGGVYIGGGVARKNLDLIDYQDFRRRFEDKGRYSDLIRTIPLYWILDEAPALQGLAYLARLE